MMLPSNRRERNTLSPVMPRRRSGYYLSMRRQGANGQGVSRSTSLADVRLGSDSDLDPPKPDVRFTPAGDKIRRPA
jgi:hypothetical protein